MPPFHQTASGELPSPVRLAIQSLKKYVDRLTGVYNVAARGTSPLEGDRHYDPDTNREWRFDGTNWLLIGGSLPRAKANRTAVQLIPLTTSTAVLWTAEDYDTDLIHDNAVNPSRFTCPAGMGGVWRFSYCIQFAAAASGARNAYMQVNATGRRYGENLVETALGWRVTGTADIILTAGQYVELIVFVGGAALNVWVSQDIDHLMGTYVGPV